MLTLVRAVFAALSMVSSWLLGRVFCLFVTEPVLSHPPSRSTRPPPAPPTASVSVPSYQSTPTEFAPQPPPSSRGTSKPSSSWRTDPTTATSAPAVAPNSMSVYQPPGPVAFAAPAANPTQSNNGNAANNDAAAFLLRQQQLAKERAAASSASVSSSRHATPIDRSGADSPAVDDAETAERLRMLAEVRRQRQVERDEAARAKHQGSGGYSDVRPTDAAAPSTIGRFRRDGHVVDTGTVVGTVDSNAARPAARGDGELERRRAMFADIMSERRDGEAGDGGGGGSRAASRLTRFAGRSEESPIPAAASAPSHSIFTFTTPTDNDTSTSAVSGEAFHTTISF